MTFLLAVRVSVALVAQHLQPCTIAAIKCGSLALLALLAANVASGWWHWGRRLPAHRQPHRRVNMRQ